MGNLVVCFIGRCENELPVESRQNLWLKPHGVSSHTTNHDSRTWTRGLLYQLLQCGITPFSRSFLRHTPPFARRGVLSQTAARPEEAQGCRILTKYRPMQPISPGRLSGNPLSLLSQVRRVGIRPFSVRRGRSLMVSSVSCSRKVSRLYAE